MLSIVSVGSNPSKKELAISFWGILSDTPYNAMTLGKVSNYWMMLSMKFDNSLKYVKTESIIVLLYIFKITAK